ncbi:unnamed protein product [Caenorhabditis auriculariae]|uniref:SGF29 C-terminal domain-containing protein n=1 Tax=Caenorhabditis auriculariae TaxID=2777116 RepID=A0A8S1HM10_9PELO|nr:unnamed protein product [Caenorhabditis auriculariae]
MVKKTGTEKVRDERKRQTALSDLHRKLVHVRNRQDKVNEALESLQNQKSILLHQNLQKSSDSLSDYIRKLLLDVEKIRKQEYESKMKNEIKRQALMQLINLQGNTLPLWVNGNEGFPGPFVGAIHISEHKRLEIGDAVAAFSNKNWILGEIIGHLPGGKYEVRDVDEEQQKKAKAIFPRYRLIPLPRFRADPQHDPHALFPLDAIVLALYPQTTCFYKGVVHKVPATPTEDYQVVFEDVSYPTGYSPPMHIPQRYVVPFMKVVPPSKKRGTRDREDEDSD